MSANEETFLRVIEGLEEAGHYVRTVAAAMPEADEARVLELGWHWLIAEEHDQRAEWAFVWQALLERAPALSEAVAETGEARLLELGWTWLTAEGHGRRPEWAFIWRALLERASALSEAVTEAGEAHVLELGWTWLTAEGHERWPEWTFVWQQLLERAPALSEAVAEAGEGRLLELGWTWLTAAGHDQRPEWTFVWRALLGRSAALSEAVAEAGEARLLELGWKWLSAEDHDQRPDWAFVWRALLERAPALAEAVAEADERRLLELGWAWLQPENRLGQDSWTFVWQVLVERPSPGIERTELLAVGWRWLQVLQHRERGEWDKIYELCLDAGFAAAGFLETGEAWCLAHSASPQTPILAAKIIAGDRGRQTLEVRRWLADWLGQPPSGRAWAEVRKRLRSWKPKGGRAGDPLGDRLRRLEELETEPWAELVRAWKAGTPVKGTVRNQTRHGCLIDLGFPGLFFLPRKQIGPSPPREWVGYTGFFMLEHLDPESRNAILSRKAWLREVKRRQPSDAFEELALHGECRGTVVHRWREGALVDVDGVICRLEEGNPVSDYPEVGEVIDARVADRDPATRRVWLERLPSSRRR